MSLARLLPDEHYLAAEFEPPKLKPVLDFLGRESGLSFTEAGELQIEELLEMVEITSERLQREQDAYDDAVADARARGQP